MDREDLNRAQRELDASRAHESRYPVPDAKSYYPEWMKGTSFEKAPIMGNAFYEAVGQDAKTHDHDSADIEKQVQEPSGSQQVKNHALTPEMRPPPEIAKPVDREKHIAEMQQDDEAARLANYEAMADRIDQKQNESQQEHGYDID